MFPIRKILHPTDFSEHSMSALHMACALARDHGAQIILLHVVVPPIVVYGEMASTVPPPDSFKEELAERLRRIEVPVPAARVERCLVEGDAAREILRMAEEANCDMIVLGTHGRTGLGRLLMGSVAEQVLRKAPCPVLTVKAGIPVPGTVVEESRELHPVG